jgi:hypothetical protein
MLSKTMRANARVINSINGINTLLGIKTNLNKSLKNSHAIHNFNNSFNSTYSINKFSNFKFSSLDKTKEEQTVNELHKYISSFTGKKFDRIEDSLLVDNKLLGKLSATSRTYPVFKSNIGSKISKVVILQLIMLIPCLFLIYYSFKSLKKEFALFTMNKSSKFYVGLKATITIGSLLVLNFLRKNNLYKIWNYVQKVELSKDLKSLQITTFTNSVIRPELKDVYLYYNFSSPYISHKSMNKVEDTLILGVGEKQYIVPLENATIQSKDLMSLCLRGYKLKFREKDGKAIEA